MKEKTPLALVILDGWGHSTKKENNAIYNAKTPTLDKLTKENPTSLLSASSSCVGLPDNQMGNSEVGHLNIGAGRIIYQELVNIGNDIKSGAFAKNETFLKAINNSKQNDTALHIMGLISDGGVHSHLDHIKAIIDLANGQNLKKLYIHAFLDGRDTPPKSAKKYLLELDEKLAKQNTGALVSIVGRFYAMDRDKRWQRVEQAYNLLTNNNSKFNLEDNISSAIENSYKKNITDEFFEPTKINKYKDIVIQDNDNVIFMNFRADRARELSYAFVEKKFSGFKKAKTPKIANFVTLTQYAKDLDTQVAYLPKQIKNTLGEVVADNKLTQLRISETEKYAHVTFFLNGGKEEVYQGESRKLIPSPKVKTYDLKPQMSSDELTQNLTKAIESKEYDLIICNYPNGDMVGHTGNYDAAILACEAVDKSIKKVVDSIDKAKGKLIITADHGNAENMLDELTKEPHTAHTTEPVPFIYYAKNNKNLTASNGRLSDLAPTILNLMDLGIPKEMTGKILIK